ncbi:MAG: protein-L-isoaspartate(D-aspartate) O-methyltransferase [Bacteroidia bacterium]|nr:MAG: protein-L-isoaspartate(D-aspartate) O-methyltransferase [Bacteroidia bacterium]
MSALVKILFPLVAILACTAGQSQQSFEAMRNNMVETQIIPRGITDRNVIRSMRKVPRHLFVPEEAISLSYGDHPLSIGDGQTISQPYIVAYMTELLKLREGMKVLEIGTGSGYQAAIIAEMGCTVYTVEIIEALSVKAEAQLRKLGYENIFFRRGDGYAGWIENSPYDAIIVTCAPEYIPEPLKAQLKEGGRMIIPVGGNPFQQLLLLRLKNGRMITKKIAPVMFVPMVAPGGKKY